MTTRKTQEPAPAQGTRRAGGYPSDLTDAQWQVIAAHGTLARLHAELRTQARVAAGRAPQPTAAVIDSQSVRAADTVPKASRGWDNAKKVNGRKRHIAVDPTGLVLDVVINAASVQDRVAARPLLWNTHRACRRAGYGPAGTSSAGTRPWRSAAVTARRGAGL